MLSPQGPGNLRSTLSPCSFPRSAFRKAISASPLFHRLQGKNKTHLCPRQPPSNPEPPPQGGPELRSQPSERADRKRERNHGKAPPRSLRASKGGSLRTEAKAAKKKKIKKSCKKARNTAGTWQEQAVTAPRLREEPRTHGRLRTHFKPFVCSSN